MIALQGNIPRLILAPMEGVVDAVMRDQLTRLGGYERCVTEFVRVSQTLLPKRVFIRYSPSYSRAESLPPAPPFFYSFWAPTPS